MLVLFAGALEFSGALGAKFGAAGFAGIALGALEFAEGFEFAGVFEFSGAGGFGTLGAVGIWLLF